MKSNLYAILILSQLLYPWWTNMMAQSPEWLWAKTIGCKNGGIFSQSLIIDHGNSDIYYSGYYLGDVDIDPGPDSFNLAGSGLFISKLDSAGNFKWVKTLEGNFFLDAWLGYVRDAMTIAIDPSGNGDVYLAVNFSDGIDVDPGEGIYNLTSAGSYDFIIVKLDSSGNFLWAKQIGGASADLVFSITISPADGAVYTTGSFKKTVDFDPGPDSYDLISPFTSQESSFVSKLDNAGDFVWARAFVGSDNQSFCLGRSVALDIESGNVYTAGYFMGTVDFDPGSDSYDLVSDLHYCSGFISKMDDSGTFISATSLETSAYDIEVEPSGSGEVYYKESGLKKFDSSGNLEWSKSLFFNVFVIDPLSGGIFISGVFFDSLDLNPEEPGFNLISSGETDIFISKFTTSGNFVWAQSIGGAKWDNVTSISTDKAGNLLILGTYYSQSISFDATTLTSADTALSYQEGEPPPNLFIAKLDTAFPVSVSNTSETASINIYPNPAVDELTIEMGEGDYVDFDITLFNILGEIVFTSYGKNLGPKSTIDVSALATGLYFVELNVEGKRVIKKVVKE